uniref:Uncharacterized protein n=1 Tax=Globodera rostochiensis TaxID=31243 RepID=A0A914IAU0_GLORO
MVRAAFAQLHTARVRVLGLFANIDGPVRNKMNSSSSTILIIFALISAASLYVVQADSVDAGPVGHSHELIRRIKRYGYGYNSYGYGGGCACAPIPPVTSSCYSCGSGYSAYQPAPPPPPPPPPPPMQPSYSSCTSCGGYGGGLSGYGNSWNNGGSTSSSWNNYGSSSGSSMSVGSGGGYGYGGGMCSVCGRKRK